MNTLPRLLIGMSVVAFVVLGATLQLHWGVYGWTLFAVSPLVLGGVAVWWQHPDNSTDAVYIGALTGACCAFALLLLGIEGAICVAMALPFTVPMGIIGGVAAAFLRDLLTKGKNVTALLLLPIATLSFDLKAKPPVYAVTTEMVINAPPEKVWQNVVEFSPIPEPREWYFHTGIAYPTSTHIAAMGLGARRYCELSTGSVVEEVDAWEPARRLHFRVLSTPDAMREWSPWGQIRPKHLHGYYISHGGEFRLIPLDGGRTLLRGTSWYQHGLWPAEYWRWWSDAIIHRIHTRVLNHVRMLSEARP